MNIPIIQFICLILWFSIELHGQVISTPAIDSLVLKTIEKNIENPTISGFRIQIYNGNSQSEADKAKTWISEFYPDLYIYIVYQAPNFKVRVGNYRSKPEAQWILFRLHDKFPSAFLVPDKISFRQIPE